MLFALWRPTEGEEARIGVGDSLEPAVEIEGPASSLARPRCERSVSHAAERTARS